MDEGLAPVLMSASMRTYSTVTGDQSSPGHHNAIVVIILPGLLSRYRLVLTLTQTCTRCLTMFDNYCYYYR